MSRSLISSSTLPPAIGPYSPGIIADGRFIFLSGQIPLDPATGKPVAGGITAQTNRVFENIQALLTAAGSSLDHVVKTTVYLVDMADFREMNEAYAAQMTAEPRPARTTIAVKELPLGVRVEIEVVALTTT